jgi:hypothetical protein
MPVVTRSERERKSALRAITARNTIGLKTLKEGLSLVKKASPDHPIYKRGLIIGGHHSGNLSKKTSK